MSGQYVLSTRGSLWHRAKNISVQFVHVMCIADIFGQADSGSKVYQQGTVYKQ